MDVSVVVPLFNAEEFIRESAGALIGQDYPGERYEIIMIDNNSTDGTVDMVRRFPRIRLLHEKRQGSYCARNRGILAADGRLIAFTDPDCRPNPDWLSSLVGVACRPGSDIVLGRQEFSSGSEGLSLLAEYESQKAEYVFSSDIKEIYYGYTNNMAVRKSLFGRLGNFVEIERGADTIFVRKAVEECGCPSVRYSVDACVRHLEIVGVWDYFRKKQIYGKSTERNRGLGSARPLSNAERLTVFLQTVRKQRYSLIRSCQLFILLSLGMGFYEFGRGTASGPG